VLDKASLRAQVKAGRAAMTDVQRESARDQILDAVRTQLRRMSLRAGSRIAAFLPMRTEPMPASLLEAFAVAGHQVIVPVRLDDNDLDWREWGTSGELLGVSAIAAAALVLVPAFAVDPAGRRLGRGGGSYDRALARVAPDVPVVAVLFDAEFVPEVPVDAWDRRVSAIVTPAGWKTLNWT